MLPTAYIKIIFAIFIAFTPACLRFRNQTDYYTLTSINNRICHESFGRVIMEFNATFDDTFHYKLCCGPVLACETSPCNFQYEIGSRYFLPLSFGSILGGDRSNGCIPLPNGDLTLFFITMGGLIAAMVMIVCIVDRESKMKDPWRN